MASVNLVKMQFHGNCPFSHFCLDGNATLASTKIIVTRKKYLDGSLAREWTSLGKDICIACPLPVTCLIVTRVTQLPIQSTKQHSHAATLTSFYHHRQVYTFRYLNENCLKSWSKSVCFSIVKVQMFPFLLLDPYPTTLCYMSWIPTPG